MTPELDLLVRRAAWIGRGDSDNPVVSFTSLFLSFLASTDGVSLWVQDKITWIGPALADVVWRWNSGRTVPRGLDEKRVQAARTRTDKELPEAQTISTSVSRVRAAARDLARRVGSDTLDVHHVLAAYLYAPLGHGEDLKAWGLDREAWATRFRCYVTAIHPEEAAAWRRLHDDSFPRQFSVGVNDILRWATPIAARTSAASIDSRALLSGILLDGLAYSEMKFACVQLVECLGGRATVEALIATEQQSERSDLDAVLPLSDEVQSIFDRALLFATAICVPSRSKAEIDGIRVLNVRHVISALLTDRRSLAAFELVRRARRTPEGLLAQLRKWLDRFDRDTATDRIEDAEVRRRIFDELRDDVLAGYDNDEAHGEDRLNIGPDVRALAAVLASTQVAPPISVGLFGDWGSGKSFFMSKLRERIAQLADAARAKPAAESWFCGGRGRVVQIEFNAWHYMDANLWSSLAVRVFDTLSDEFQGEFARACLRQLDSLKEREAELQAAHGQLTAAEAALDQRLADQRALRAKRTLELGAYVEVIAGEAAREVAADPRVKAVTERLRLQGKAIETELHLIKGDLETAGGSARRWWQTLRSPGRLITLGLVLVAPVIVGAVSSAYVAAGSAAATSIATLVVAIAAVGSRVWQGARQLKGLLGDALAQIDRIESKAREKKTKEERQIELDREQIGTRISELERDQLQLSKQRTDLEAQISALQQGNKKTLKEFILQRAASDDYRKNLGIISAVHRDFKELAEFLAPGGEPPHVERIILYIDDLDRCPPERVVEVLQAIHVILSLPLFVVVVGVDSRWLLDSLTTYYRRQFPADASAIDAARPQSYLEKIFQIPFTLMPMSHDGYDSLVGSLLQRHVDAVPEGPAGEAVAANLASRRESSAPARTTVATRAAPGRDTSSRVDLTPRGLRLEPRELDHVRTLSSLISSPRAAKRLVNLYRIVRAGLDDEALDRLIEGRYKLTQICLAIVVGNSTFGAELFGQILSGKLQSRGELVKWCGDRPEATPRASARDTAAIRELVARSVEFADWGAVCDAVGRVARFSFETGRILGFRMLERSAEHEQRSS